MATESINFVDFRHDLTMLKWALKSSNLNSE